MGGEVMPLDITAAEPRLLRPGCACRRGRSSPSRPSTSRLNLVAHKIAPALACGCSIVLKPPPQAPLTVAPPGRVHPPAGAPDGAVQVVPCDNVIAETPRPRRALRHALLHREREGRLAPQVHRRKEARAARARRQRRGDRPRGRALRPARASASSSAAFGYAGQVCIKVQRLYVHRAIADGFVARLVTARGRDPADVAARSDGLLRPDDRRGRTRSGSTPGSTRPRAPGPRCSSRGQREGNRLSPDDPRDRRRRPRN